MPLNPSPMIDTLENIFKNYPDSFSQTANQIATAYNTYALAGIFGPGTIPSLPGISGLESQILSGFNSKTASGVANGFAAGITALWVAVPLVVAGGTGVTIACPGAASLAGILTGVFSNLNNTARSAAEQIGNALHTATATTTATIIIPPAPPVVTPIA